MSGIKPRAQNSLAWILLRSHSLSPVELNLNNQAPKNHEQRPQITEIPLLFTQNDYVNNLC